MARHFERWVVIASRPVSRPETWQRVRSVLRVLALVGLFALAAVTTRETFTRFVRAEPHETCADRLEQRYAPVRRHLPRRGVIGYFGPELTEDGCNAKFIAQYVLAPMLVSHVWEVNNRRAARRTDFVVPTNLPLVLVDTDDPEANAWLQTTEEYQVITNFGNGVVLAGRTR